MQKTPPPSHLLRGLWSLMMTTSTEILEFPPALLTFGTSKVLRVFPTGLLLLLWPHFVPEDHENSLAKAATLCLRSWHQHRHHHHHHHLHLLPPPASIPTHPHRPHHHARQLHHLAPRRPAALRNIIQDRTRLLPVPHAHQLPSNCPNKLVPALPCTTTRFTYPSYRRR